MSAAPRTRTHAPSAASEYLSTFANWEHSVPAEGRRAFNLERIGSLLARLGNPHVDRPSLHVTGTKGKGSTVCFADAILLAHGLRTFRFTSPHVERLNERIAVDGADVTDDALAAAVATIKPAIEAVRTTAPEDVPTYFEALTALGFLIAREQRVDADVVEVGLGGRLDATNVIRPVVSVVTSIDLDHTRILGDTREQIAAEKAGIVKPGVPVLAGLEAGDPACRVILARAAALGAPVAHAGNGVDVLAAEPVRGPRGRPGVRFRGAVDGLRVDDAWAPGGGVHQAMNALLAIGAARRVLEASGRTLSLDAATAAIASTTLPARAEVFGSAPPVLLDVAHTPPSCAALAALVRWLFAGRPLVLLAGLTRERSPRAVFAPFADAVREAVFVPIASPRSADPGACAEAWMSLGGRARAAADASRGLDAALAAAGRGGAVVVAGSFYLAGAVRPELRNLV
jgi:dihydrofolate synthase/folylpolyglutamate synthase